MTPTASIHMASSPKQKLSSMHSSILVSHGFQSHYELGFANGLAQNHVQVTLLGSDTTLADKLAEQVEFINIRGPQSPNRSRWAKLKNMVGYHFKLLRHVATHRQAQVCVIGLTNPELLVGILEGFFLRVVARRYCLTVHNILPHDKHTAWMKCLYWLIYRLPHLLLVHTPETAQALTREFGIDSRKIVVVEHGANDAVEKSSLTPAQARESLGFEANDRVLLFFGGVAPYKGLDLLLDALERHAGTRLLVAGRCPDSEYGRAMRDRLQTLVQNKKAIWRNGYLDESAISLVFAAADAIVLPYRHIDQSGVLLLALTLGTPLITTRVGSFSSLVTPATGVLVEPFDSNALARGITEFYAALPTLQPEHMVAMAETLAWKNTVKPLLFWLT
ncbi:glycosyltransferase [Rhodoferax mekongensis]|uniref:Glycosyltransferase n=1 Tax=Rhodoferax mekongensis TaxID=3068341 RepID=A0ABZ0B3F4_9BURK|nr:glycosyltransferase [Rhodoferax sp. TBRC 17307]WNO06250.1 glycosyltransferase [Rhodoferax sp. TBRC 17307]